MNRDNKLSETDVWLPQGDWFDFFTGMHYYSPNNINRFKAYRSIEQYPVFAKSGAIIPMMVQPPHEHRCMSSEKTEILVFPGSDNSFELYEDAGDGFDYENGDFCKTNMHIDWANTDAVFVIEPADGELSLIPKKRNWSILLRGFNSNMSVNLFVNEKELEVKPILLKESNTVKIEVTADVTDTVRVEMSAEDLIHDNSDWLLRCEEILMRTNMYSTDKQKIMDIVRMDTVSTHDKISKLFYETPSAYPTILALREMMTLTKKEYDIQ